MLVLDRSFQVAGEIVMCWKRGFSKIILRVRGLGRTKTGPPEFAKMDKFGENSGGNWSNNTRLYLSRGGGADTVCFPVPRRSRFDQIRPPPRKCDARHIVTLRACDYFRFKSARGEILGNIAPTSYHETEAIDIVYNAVTEQTLQ